VFAARANGADAAASVRRVAFSPAQRYPTSVRRSLWSRSIIAIWSLWLGVVLAAPQALRPCPLHGDHAAHMSEAAAHVAGHSHGGAPADHSKQPCTCLGACCCANAVAVPQLDVADLPTTDVAFVRVAIPAAPAQAPFVAPEYSHPFANGPPHSPVTAARSI